MTRKEEVQKAIEFYHLCIELLEKKANDYANDDECFSNFTKTSEQCEIPIEKVFLMAMNIKHARLVELTKKTNNVEESKTDSLIDMANYACLYALWLNDNTETKRPNVTGDMLT